MDIYNKLELIRTDINIVIKLIEKVKGIENIEIANDILKQTDSNIKEWTHNEKRKCVTFLDKDGVIVDEF